MRPNNPATHNNLLRKSCTIREMSMKHPEKSYSLVCLQIEHLDGHKVTLASEGVTVPGGVAVLPGEGMPLFEQVRPVFGFRVQRLRMTHSKLAGHPPMMHLPPFIRPNKTL